MPGRIILDAFNPALDEDGDPISGATMTFYENGTTTLKNVYITANLDAPHLNPLVADAAGRFPPVWAANGAEYTVVWKDDAGVVIRTFDDIVPFGDVNLSGGTATGTANAITIAVDDFDETDGQILTFIASATNTGATTITVNGTTYDIVQDTAGGPAALDGAEIISGNAIALIYDKAGDQFHIVTVPPATAQGTISPPAITTQQDDWHPTGLMTAETIRITSTGAQSISGIAAPASDNVQLTLENIDSADAITLLAESASSVAANRFAFATNVTVGIKETITLKYDLTSARWRLFARGFTSGAYNRAKITANGTWTVPGNVTAATYVKFRYVGGGGGGGGANTSAGACGSGAGSGAYGESVFYGFTAGQNVTVVIGAAGVGAAGIDGTAGTATTLTYATVAIVTAAGGALGAADTGGTASRDGGAAGAVTILMTASGLTEVDSMLFGAQPGGASSSGGSATLGKSGEGGGNPFGTGGKSKGGADAVGQAGTGFGSGGSGAFRSGAGNLTGGAGMPGVVLIEWWV